MTRKFSSTSIETTLAAGINSTTTSITIAAGTASALLNNVTLAVGNVDQFTVALDVDTQNEEIVFVTGVSGDTLTVVRAGAGTSGIAHTAGASVKHVLTSDDLNYFTAQSAVAAAAIPVTTVLAKGDLIAGTASGVVSRLGVGTTGQALLADSTTATGLKWGSASATPRIGQVVQATTSSSTSTTSTSYVDATGMTATITPTLSNSKVLVTMSFDVSTEGTPSSAIATLVQMVRDATAVYSGATVLAFTTQLTSTAVFTTRFSLSYVDSPATTSATTYKLQLKRSTGATASSINPGNSACSVILQEVLV